MINPLIDPVLKYICPFRVSRSRSIVRLVAACEGKGMKYRKTERKTHTRNADKLSRMAISLPVSTETSKALRIFAKATTMFYPI